MLKTDDLHIANFKPLISPDELKKELPLTKKSIEVVVESRKAIADIINGKDKRKFIIVGPCSIHDPNSALEYAQKLSKLSLEVSDTFILAMRAYFEKPRTTVGWKGFINDPMLDNSFNINQGLMLSRKLLLSITEMGLPVGTEALEPISPQYIAELISWTAIGARTTESQTHRELASGLSSPVGFKNNTDGNIEVAINAIKSASLPHHFLGIDQYGRTSIVATKGNPHTHLILRGGKAGPNYDKDSITKAVLSLEKAKLRKALVVDCSHDNSLKDFRNQPQVFNQLIDQIALGNQSIVGLMLESHLFEGQQPLKESLGYGISVTDGCIGFDLTAKIIKNAQKILSR
jgi:3-deoxy-7-phosphoheptulonate synthase